MNTYDELLAKITRYKELDKENGERGGLSFNKARESYQLEEYIRHNIISALRDGYELTRLDEIRAEIEMERLEDSPNFCIKAHNEAVDRVLQIIDKYRKEQN